MNRQHNPAASRFSAAS